MSVTLMQPSQNMVHLPVWGTSALPQLLPRGMRVGQNLPVMGFAQDAEIYAEGDEAGCFYKVVSGVVRTCKFQTDGRRHVDAFYMPGDVFGFEAGEIHALSAEAVNACTVAPLRRRALENEAAYDEATAMQLYQFAMQALARTRMHAQILGRGSAAQKLLAFLAVLARPGCDVIELPMTRQDMADYLGLTIETVSRTLAQLEREGVISLLAARRIAVRNKQALRAART